MKFNTNIKIGSLAKDRVMNVSGTIVGVAVERNGNWRVDLQPPSTDNKFIEPYSVDYVNIDITDGGVDNPMPDSKFELNQKVKDSITHIEGYVHKIIWHTNGCIFIKIKCIELDKLTGSPKYLILHENELEAMAEPPVNELPDKAPGGPNERVCRPE